MLLPGGLWLCVCERTHVVSGGLPLAPTSRPASATPSLLIANRCHGQAGEQERTGSRAAEKRED